jgi:PAS domain S-box-containing protein
MREGNDPQQDLLRQIEKLYARLEEPEEIVRALREGEIDALVVQEGGAERLYILKTADRPYRLMIEAMGQGALTLTPDGFIAYCNPCFARLVQQSTEKVSGSLLQGFVRPEDVPRLTALIEEGIGEGSHGELFLRRADGSEVPVVLALSGLDLDGNKVLCGVVTDLTEQNRAVRAEAASQAKDQFLAALSHELRTPLTPVLAIVSALEHDRRLPHDLRREIARIQRNVELEVRLIDDMLDLTRIGQGKLVLDRRPTDVHEVLENAAQICCAAAASAGHLTVERQLASAEVAVLADPVRLTQVFWNLLSNAVKFTPAGGTVTLRTRVDDGEGGSREEPGGGIRYLVAEVSDTGIGIESGSLEQIFGAFDQGQAEVGRRFGGLGLGLAISRAIVELHGGELDVWSAGKDRGATFSVRLPLPSSAPPPGDQASRPAAPATLPVDLAAPLHLLLVEDHADTAEALALLLGNLGYEMTVAGTVAAGLAAARAAEEARQRGDGSGIDLVISDLGLPDGSGLDLMRELSGRYGLSGLALSGFGMEEDVRRSGEAGFTEHLTKPVDLQALHAAILRSAGARRE